MTDPIDGRLTGIEFDEIAARDIRELRATVTERARLAAVDPVVAPLWNELFTPIDRFTGGDQTDGLPLTPPGRFTTTTDQALALRSAQKSVRELASEGGDERIARLAELLETHVAVQTELIRRRRM